VFAKRMELSAALHVVVKVVKMQWKIWIRRRKKKWRYR